jgi:TM2 domain-containing membrane protein YozV
MIFMVKKTKKVKVSEKEKTTALILSILGLIGFAGIHRFYVGKIWTGILWFITGGLFYIGTIVDIIQIANGTFKDKQEAFLTK